MAIPIFITGIGTGVGKTLAAAIITEALQADYWKPVQTGMAGGGELLGRRYTDALESEEIASMDVEDPSDSAFVSECLSNNISKIHPECYRLAMAASPHIAARAENIRIDVEGIIRAFKALPTVNKYVIVEGAGGLLVPLNESIFMSDLARLLGGKVILVSQYYLGSINHSLLTSRVCRQDGLNVAGWIFNGYNGQYEEEIVHWSGYPALANVPLTTDPGADFVRRVASYSKEALLKVL